MSQRYTYAQPDGLPHQLGAEDVFLCSDWHGGQTSMMYAGREHRGPDARRGAPRHTRRP